MAKLVFCTTYIHIYYVGNCEKEKLTALCSPALDDGSV